MSIGTPSPRWAMIAVGLACVIGLPEIAYAQEAADSEEPAPKPKKKKKKKAATPDEDVVAAGEEADEEEAPPKKKKKAEEAPAVEEVDVKRPTWSLAIERIGGMVFSKAASSDTDAGVSLFSFGVGGLALNPYALPRAGIDYILANNLTLGTGVGFGRQALGTSSNGSSSDVGSVFLYTLSPRAGYRFVVAPKVDITPRLGVTLVGASGSSGNQSVGVFALALSADSAVAFRLTESFNLLAGLGFDQTISVSASQTSGSGSTSKTSSQDIHGALFAIQAWLGVGGYL